MPATGYPIQMADGVPVITAPAEIDVTTADQLRAVLLDCRTGGHATVVVDLAGTRFCDSAGLRELARAHEQARADGGGLRLVIPADGAVVRVLALTGLDRLIPRFASRERALAAVREQALVAGDRRCEQCGAAFVPRREHARFCGVICRAAWNREHLGDPTLEASALTWSVTAMSEATARLSAMTVWDRPQALAAIGEAVWWVTMVDATLVRHQPGLYDAVLAAQAPAERPLIEQTLAGLRFVRNWIGRDGQLGEVIDTGGTRAATQRITGWTWKHVPRSAITWLAPRGQAWEMSRYRAYQAHLAGRTIRDTLGRAVTFVTLTGANAAPITEPSEHASGWARR